jgi:hypothetical protein
VIEGNTVEGTTEAVAVDSGSTTNITVHNNTLYDNWKLHSGRRVNAGAGARGSIGPSAGAGVRGSIGPSAGASVRASAGAPTVLQLLQSTPELSNLTRYFMVAQLADRINGSSLVTVFAPTNAAYAAMAGGHWPRNNSETLQRLLLYHCAYGDIVSSALKAAQHIQVSGPKMQQLTQIYTITDCCLVAFCTWIPTTRLWTDKAYS